MQTERRQVIIRVAAVILVFFVFYGVLSFFNKIDNLEVLLKKQQHTNVVPQPITIPILQPNIDGDNYMYEKLQEFQAVIDEAAGGREHIIGNIGWHRLQSYYYWLKSRLPNVHQICEIGFGAGHSPVIYLTAKPTNKLVVFDLFPKEYRKELEMVPSQHLFQAAAIKYIYQNFPGRFVQVEGDSSVTVPKFAADKPHFKCDLISIDGSHNPEMIYKDVKNMKALAHKDTIVLMDDMGVDYLYAALTRAKNDNIVEELECLEGGRYMDRRFTHAEVYDIGKRFCAVRYKL